MFSSTCRFEEADETDLPFTQSPEAVAERLRIISSSSIEGSRLPNYNTSITTFRRVKETETDLPLVRSPEAEAVAERQSLISSLNIEPSFLCYSDKAPPAFEDVALPAVIAPLKAPQTWATEEPRSLPLAPPGARFLATWPSATSLSTIAEEAVAERLRRISFLSIGGSRLHKYYNTSTATFSRFRKTKTDLPLAQSPKADAEHRRLISSLNIGPSVFSYAFNAPPGFEDLAPLAVKALQRATQEPRSLPLALPGARFLTTWPSVSQSTIEEVQPQINALDLTNWSPFVRDKRGECVPCAFFTTNRGCPSGVGCTFCLLCQKKVSGSGGSGRGATFGLPAASDY
ncbi:unnamed protein product [Polarella glacialis]|uniref:Uncharacterized protein n=1 Tax=Polarella glacialis TaxID=89957 RepID=A0A813IMH8_POLGL|nr:unnamed protein product [Polarella glacialis]